MTDEELKDKMDARIKELSSSLLVEFNHLRAIAMGGMAPDFTRLYAIKEALDEAMSMRGVVFPGARGEGDAP